MQHQQLYYSQQDFYNIGNVFAFIAIEQQITYSNDLITCPDCSHDKYTESVIPFNII